MKTHKIIVELYLCVFMVNNLNSQTMLHICNWWMTVRAVWAHWEFNTTPGAPWAHTQVIFVTLRMTEILQNSSIVTKKMEITEKMFCFLDKTLKWIANLGIQKLLSLELYDVFIWFIQILVRLTFCQRSFLIFYHSKFIDSSWFYPGNTYESHTMGHSRPKLMPPRHTGTRRLAFKTPAMGLLNPMAGISSAQCTRNKSSHFSLDHEAENGNTKSCGAHLSLPSSSSRHLSCKLL